MRVNSSLKRAVDVVAALMALVILMPVLLVIGIAVRLDSTGGALYRGRRVGRFGKPFDLLKFRTMVPHADSVGPLVTASGDPRVTRLGRFLRRTKLDELPSLWNVVTGDMSLVGPRPENERSAAAYDAEQQQVWLLRPGLTSIATLKYRHEETILAGAADLDAAYYRIMQDKLSLDLRYLREQSLWLDLRILAQTVVAIFR